MPRYNLESVRKMFADAGCVFMEHEYINCETKMKYLCSCDSTNVHWITLTHFRLGIRCEDCRWERRKATNKERYGVEHFFQLPTFIEDLAEDRKHDFDYVKKFFEERGCKLISTEYVNSKSKLKYVCECGREAKISFNHFAKGERCNGCARQRMEATVMERYGTKTYSQTDECKEKLKQKSLEVYGVEHRLQNAEEFERHVNNSAFRRKEFKFPSGKIITVQGYEDVALKYLLKFFKEDDILTDRCSMPEVWYSEQERNYRRYYCDMYIPKANLVIEVKSWYYYVRDIVNITTKRKAVEALGYKYKMLLYQDHRRLLTPFCSKFV